MGHRFAGQRQDVADRFRCTGGYSRLGTASAGHWRRFGQKGAAGMDEDPRIRDIAKLRAHLSPPFRLQYKSEQPSHVRPRACSRPARQE